MSSTPVAVTSTTDIEFARIDGVRLAIDLHRPDLPGAVPVVLYLHGGGWQVGTRADHAVERMVALAAQGVAVASADYRFAHQATHPAQVHDVKAAVRWLRAHGAEHALATERIGIWGASAGAYLASMVALTAGDPELEGTVGDAPDRPSHVDAAVHWFGQSDLLRNSRRSELEQRILAPAFEPALLGVDDVAAHQESAREASPVHRVHPAAPPFLIAHGDHDRITPSVESRSLHEALVAVGVSSTFLLLGGAGHEGVEFDHPDHLAMTAAFLVRRLTGTAAG